MELEVLTEKIKHFNPELFFKWINIISIHPANQMCLMRFELILSAFFSIHEDDFLGRKNTRNDIIDFFKEINDDFNTTFYWIEDYEPFNQNDLIPLFVKGNKYLFFYGLIENPYTRINVLSKVINDLDADNSLELLHLKYAFTQSLIVQTNILENTTKDKESFQSNEDENILIPTQNYFDYFSPLLKLDNKSNIDFCKLGFLNSKKDYIIEECFNYKVPCLFKSPFVTIDNTAYIILPHIHIECFGYYFKEIINQLKNSEKVWGNIDEQLNNRIDILCIRFFNINTRIGRIFANRESSENLLEKYNVASCFRIDQNKLLVFKSIKHKENKNFTDRNSSYELAKNEIKRLDDAIKGSKEIGLDQYSYKHIFGINPEILEIWYIFVNESISLEQDFLMFEKRNINEHLVEIGDLAFLFDKFFEFRADAPIQFLKFLQNDKDLLNSPNRLLTTNYVDRIAIYMSGHNFYFKYSKSPDLINIAPYEGNAYESKYYYDKFKDKAYETIERRFPEEFNIIEHIEGEFYRGVDTAFINLIFFVNIPQYPIFIYPPRKISALNDIDKKFLISILPQLMGFYIDKLSDEFISLLKMENIFPLEYSLLLVSNASLEQKENELPYLLPLAEHIGEEPLLFSTKRLQNGGVRTFVIANTKEIKTILDLFEPENNSAERYCIKKLIESIFEFNKNNNKEKLSNDFIDKHIPFSKKSFSFNQLTLENPHLEKYDSPIKINSSDIGKVNKLFAEYLASKSLRSGEYIENEAKEINGDIFDFLQNLLEDTIKEFDENIIFYAYQQLEFSEGKREKNRLKYGMSSQRDIEYDLKEKASEEIREIILLSAYSKHIIHTILKINPTGEKYITESDWTFLLGIVAALMEIVQIYEYINYDLSPHKMIISDLYEITTEKISDKINHEKWESEFVELQIESSKNAYEKSKKHFVEKEAQENSDIQPSLNILTKKIDKLDTTFQTKNGYSLINFIQTIYALSRSNFKKYLFFPIFIVTIDDIIAYINEIFPEIENEEIIKIIENASLSFATYKQENKLIPSELLRSRNRLNVCPLIKLNEDEYIFGNQQCKFSHNIWLNELVDGDFPYHENDEYILKELDEIHKINSNQLEKDAANHLKTLLGDKYVLLNLKKFNQISPSLPKDAPCGEIDILCVDPQNRKLFVFEAKSILQKNRPYSIKQTFNDFFGEKGKRYYNKLNKKYDFVNSNIERFVQYFGLEYNEQWQVKKAFVIDKRIFAAYHMEYDIEFLLISELPNFINA